MKKLKCKCVVLLVVGVAALGFGNENKGAGDDVIFGSGPAAGGLVQEASMQDLLGEYLAKVNWGEGENIQNGTPIFVATGVAVIRANRNSPEYISAKINAFDKAFLRAKQQMAEYVGEKISTEALLTYSEGKADAFDQPEGGPPSLWTKTIRLMHAKLDKMLKSGGVDDKDVISDREKLAKLAKSSDEYRRFSTTMASAMVSGLQAFKVFETAGEVGVVAVYSKTCNELAYAIAADKPMALSARKGLPLMQQVASDTNALWSSYGAVQKIDENGERVLVAFGQSMPVTPSQESRNMAERAAKAVALGYMRSYAGEMVKTSQDILRADTGREFDNLTVSYENQNAYRESIRTTADSMSFSGVQTLFRWRAAHPLNGAEVCGVVLVWSPSRSRKAQGVAAGMKRDRVEAATDGNVMPAITLPRVNTTQVNEGFEGDKDAL